jgi:hypothetical protein
MKPAWKLVTLSSAILLIISAYATYRFYTTPATITSSVIDLRYQQEAHYTYTASVKPSITYDNKTQIDMSEPLYSKLVKEMVITLHYSLSAVSNQTGLSDVVVSYEAKEVIDSGDWLKEYPLAPRIVDRVFDETYILNIQEITRIVEDIGRETGVNAVTYTYEIQPKISLEASAGGKPVSQEFLPLLKINFRVGKITFEGLDNIKSDTLSHVETLPATWTFLIWHIEIGTMRIISIISLFLFLALLGVSVRFVIVERSSRPYLHTLDNELREKIVETTDPPDRRKRNVIGVASLEDLGKISDETFKPILHYGSIFYIIDGDVKYEFHMATEGDVEEN